jgi:hypothetical protein
VNRVHHHARRVERLNLGGIEAAHRERDVQRPAQLALGGGDGRRPCGQDRGEEDDGDEEKPTIDVMAAQ